MAADPSPMKLGRRVLGFQNFDCLFTLACWLLDALCCRLSMVCLTCFEQLATKCNLCLS